MAACLVNPLFVFLAVWAVASVLYLGGLHADLFPPATGAVFALVGLNVATFSLGYLTWAMLRRLSPAEDSLLPPSGTPLTEERLRQSLHATFAAGLAVLILCGVRVFVIAKAYDLDPIQLLTNPKVLRGWLVRFLDEAVSQTQLTAISISVGNALFSIGFVLLGVLLYFGRSKRKYVYVVLFLLLSISIGLINMNRKEVVNNILFLLYSYLLMHAAYRVRKTSDVVLGLFVPILFLALLFAVVEALLDKRMAYDRPDKITGFLFTVYWYVASPLAAFGEFLKDGHEAYLMGRSLFFPLHKWLFRLGLAEQSPLAVFGERVYIPHGANVYTYLRDMYEDFGVLGVAVVPYALGWLVSAIRHRAEAFVPYLNLYLILLVLITFSFFNYMLKSNQYYLQIAFGWFFFRLDMRSLVSAHDSENLARRSFT